MNTSKRRRSYRKRIKKTAKRFSYILDNSYLIANYPPDDPWLISQIKEDEHEFIRVTRIAANTSCYSYSEPDWTASKIIVAESDNLQQFKEDCSEFNPIRLRFSRRTMRDLI